MSVSRKVLRKKFAQLLSAALVDGTPKLAAKVYDYNTDDFGNNTPAVVVKSGGSDRPRITARGGSGLSGFLEVIVFVRYTLTAEENNGTEWTPEDSEDRLDDIEAAIATVVADNVSYKDSGQTTPYWDSLGYEDVTTVGSITVEELGGIPYRVEAIRLKAEVFRNED